MILVVNGGVLSSFVDDLSILLCFLAVAIVLL